MDVFSHSPLPSSGGSNVITGSVRCAESVVSGATERLNCTITCAFVGTSASPSPGMTCCTSSSPATVNFLRTSSDRPVAGPLGTWIV